MDKQTGNIFRYFKAAEVTTLIVGSTASFYYHRLCVGAIFPAIAVRFIVTLKTVGDNV